MSIADLLRRVGGCTHHSRHHLAAIIVAGGSGSRMGADRPKQWLTLAGQPVVLHTLRAFQASCAVREIVVVAREEDRAAYLDYKRLYGLDKLTAVVVGGDTRQASVANGIKAVSRQTDYVAIHDAARPLITPAQIDRVATAAFYHRAAAAATPATDTVKRANDRSIITETIDRKAVWLAQTPQIFYLPLYYAAMATAEQDTFAATDDCMLAEHAGFPVHLVDCGKENMKITVPVDLCIAEAILAARGEVGKDTP